MAIPDYPETRREAYLSNIASGAGAIPDHPETREEAYLSNIALGSGDIPDHPEDRIEAYLHNIASGDGAIPDHPETRIEAYLHNIATGSGAIPDHPETRLEAYLAGIIENGGAGGSWQTFEGNPVEFDARKAHALRSCVVAIEPVQSGSGDPSPDNVRPISGWTGCNVYATGKNLFDRGSAAFKSGCYLNASGEEKTDASYQYTEAYVPVPAGATIHFSYNKTTSNKAGFTVCEYDENKNFLYRETLFTASVATGNKSVSLTLSASARFIRFSCPYASGASAANGKGTKNMQIELGSAATDYEPYAGASLAIDWTDEAGTVYGGTLDATTGLLTVDRELVTITSCVPGSVKYARFVVGPYGYTVGNGTVRQISNALKLASSTANLTAYSFIVINSEGFNASQVNICINNTEYATSTACADAVNAWLAELNDAGTPLQVSFGLKTPVTYQLTAEQVNALAGRNVMWTDCESLTVDAKGTAVELDALQSLNLLMGGRYVNNNTPDDVPDDEALSIVLGGDR